MIKSTRIFKKPNLNLHLYDAPSKGRTERNYLLLDFNERTKSPHKKVLEALINCAKTGSPEIYPDYTGLGEAIAGYAKVKPSEVLPTNGSDHAIDVIFRELVEQGDKVIIPEPTFSTLEDSAKRQRAAVISPRPRYKGESLDFPFEDVMSSIDPSVRLVVICNPNNPTGTVVSREQLVAVIRKASKVGADVLVDEAYHEFARGLTVADLIGEFNNLYVTRTLSKAMGIASVRAGYIVSQGKNIDELKKIPNPYAVNSFAVAAIKTLKFPEVVADIEAYATEVMQISKPLVEEFYRQNGIRFFPSAANFHLLKAEKGLAEFLQSKGIFVRVKDSLPGLVRVSIGTKEDTQRYIEAFQEYLKAPK